ncbi:MAG: Mannosyl-glycoprotein endo-beta-N-acetylglucosaminidase [Bacteroidota bacterium]|jgi:uncharacterized FlgJ-related protein
MNKFLSFNPAVPPDPVSTVTGRRRTSLTIALFGLFFVVFFFLFTVNDYSSIDYGSVLYFDLVRSKHVKPSDLNEDNVRKEIEKSELLCPNLVFAQIMLESGNLGSYLARKTNNLIGMRFPFKRTTKAVGLYLPDKKMIVLGDQRSLLKFSNMKNYAVYSNWQDCLADYKCWQDECFKLQERYLHFLGQYYAEDDAYIDKLKTFSRK